MPSDAPPCPYTMSDPPISSGRALLSRLLWEWCCMHWGLSNEEVAAALADGAGRERGGADASEDPDAVLPADRESVRGAVRLIGRVLADGALRSYARPFGGGDPVELRPGLWEIDDHRRRFATSSINLESPFDPAAAPTHWLFVDAEDGERLVDAGTGRVPASTRRRSDGSDGGGATMAAAAEPTDIPVVRAKESLLRRDEVQRRTGLPRSSIYARIKQGRFPKQVEMGGSSGWYESEVDAWIASPR